MTIESFLEPKTIFDYIMLSFTAIMWFVFTIGVLCIMEVSSFMFPPIVPASLNYNAGSLCFPSCFAFALG